jgi:3-oxoacyl-[acyl-carrier protein] reductase
LRQRTALITGSARGLGASIAHYLASQGIKVGINYRNSYHDASSLQEELQNKYGVPSLLIQGDVRIPAHSEKMVHEIIEKWGRLDILIHNAGPYIKERKKLTDYSLEEWQEIIEGNLSSAFYLFRAAIPHMRKNKWGRIVTIGFDKANSAPGWMYRSAFAAAKSGLVSLTKTIALEEAEYCITANMVCPGDITDEYKDKKIEEVRTIRDETSPVGRPGTGEDIARAISFFCNEESDFITGSVLEVTGGKDVLNKYKWLREE